MGKELNIKLLMDNEYPISITVPLMAKKFSGTNVSYVQV